MSSNPVQSLKSPGQAVWIDSIRRGHTASGGLADMVRDDGISGETSNSAIFENAILCSSDYDDDMETKLETVGSQPDAAPVVAR